MLPSTGIFNALFSPNSGSTIKINKVSCSIAALLLYGKVTIQSKGLQLCQ
jgi:hypothetical protein